MRAVSHDAPNVMQKLSIRMVKYHNHGVVKAVIRISA